MSETITFNSCHHTFKDHLFQDPWCNNQNCIIKILRVAFHILFVKIPSKLYRLITCKFSKYSSVNLQNYHQIISKALQSLKKKISKKDLDLITSYRDLPLSELKIKANNVLEEFKSAMVIKDMDGLTLIHWAVILGETEKVKFIANAAPEAFKKAMTIKDQKGSRTPINIAAGKEYIEILKIMAESDLKTFKLAMTIEDSQGLTPVGWAVYQENMEMVKLFIKIAPEEFRAATAIRGKNNQNPFKIATVSGDMEMVKFMAEKAPAEFVASMVPTDFDGDTSFHSAAMSGNMELLKFMVEAEPAKFIAAIPKTNRDGFTLFHAVASNGNLEMLKFMIEVAPKEFLAAMVLKDVNGYTPFHLAIRPDNAEILQFMANQAPEAFSDALMILTTSGDSLLSLSKTFRPDNYKQITKLYKDKAELTEVNREFFNRKALSHAWNISGETELINSNTKKTIAKFPLTGHRSEPWYHLMNKDFSKFKKAYPTFLAKTELTSLEEALNFGANYHSYSPEEKVKRVHDRKLPTFLLTGYKGHAVTLLIFDDQFVICNRNGSSRRPIEIYHFDPQTFDKNILDEIEKIAIFGNEKDFTKYYYKTLPRKLKFSQTELDKRLEVVYPLPLQTVGNCSIVSPITGIYGLLLLEGMRSKNKTSLHNHLSAESLVAEQGLVEISLYRTWLAFEQLHILEREIKFLEKQKLTFEPDHKLIMEALTKAHVMELDEFCTKKLEAITHIYMSFLSKNNKEALRAKVMLLFKLPKDGKNWSLV